MPDDRPLSRQAQRDPAGVSAVHALLARLIDHAALFPPASLSMDAALAADRAARAGEHAWMLGRFICPASRLGELPSVVPDLSVVLDGGAADVDAVLGSGLPVELVEARLSPELLEADLGAVRAFWEVAPGADVRGLPGAKVRCGGVTADAFPPVEAVAAFMAACRDAGVAFKATAGLHHPIRHVDAGTGFVMHGFLNLLAAAVFAHAEGLGEAEIAALLAEEDPDAFSVGPDGLAVHGRFAGADAIAAARRELFVAYGSCSFSEPVEDLQALGVL
jgi:hypothetical protein